MDVSPEAVDRTIRAGGAALCRSVFDPLPKEGEWGTVLLMDGNIGIGGDPAALLRRTAELAAPGGLLVVETAAYEVDERVEVRVDDGRGGRGAAFPGPASGPAPCCGTRRRRAGRPSPSGPPPAAPSPRCTGSEGLAGPAGACRAGPAARQPRPEAGKQRRARTAQAAVRARREAGAPRRQDTVRLLQPSPIRVRPVSVPSPVPS